MNDADEALRELLTAAVRAIDAAQRSYGAQRPQDHAAYCALVECGGAQLYATVTLTPAPQIQVGVMRGEERHPFFSCSVQAGRAN